MIIRAHFIYQHQHDPVMVVSSHNHNIADPRQTFLRGRQLRREEIVWTSLTENFICLGGYEDRGVADGRCPPLVWSEEVWCPHVGRVSGSHCTIKWLSDCRVMRPGTGDQSPMINAGPVMRNQRISEREELRFRRSGQANRPSSSELEDLDLWWCLPDRRWKILTVGDTAQL